MSMISGETIEGIYLKTSDNQYTMLTIGEVCILMNRMLYLLFGSNYFLSLQYINLIKNNYIIISYFINDLPLMIQS